MERFEQLVARYLDGQTSPEDRDELADLLRSSPGCYRVFLDVCEIDQLLQALHAPQDAAAIEAILAQVRRESDPFVESVVREVRSGPVRNKRGYLVRERLSQWFGARRMHLRFVAAAVIALFLGLIFWLFNPTLGEPVLAQIQGTSATVERGLKFIPAAAGMALQPGDILRTATNATITIGFGAEKTSLRLDEQTELTLAAFKRGKSFKLQTGIIEADVSRQGPFRPLMVTTPNAEARVLGTRFRLEATAGRTQLDVTKGQVRLKNRTNPSAKPAKVSTGEYAIVAAATELNALPRTGNISREWWTNATVTNLTDLPGYPHFSVRPAGSDLADTLELAPVTTNRMLMRFRGYIHPPASGKYEFWLGGAGGARLFLADSEQSGDKVLVANNAEVKLGPREWDAPRFQGGSQWCPPVPLVAGRRYYLEALLLVPSGEGHLSVAWKRPGAERELLTGEFLSPIKINE